MKNIDEIIIVLSIILLSISIFAISLIGFDMNGYKCYTATYYAEGEQRVGLVCVKGSDTIIFPKRE
jgi:hypothetical protein